MIGEVADVEPTLAIVGLLVALLGVDILRRLDDWFAIFGWLPASDSKIVRSNVRKWLATGVLLGFVLFVERQSLASIGFESMAPTRFFAWVAGGTVGLILFVYAVAILWEAVGPGFPEENETARQLKNGSPGLRAFTAVTAGVTESILMQGYPIERLIGLLGTVPAAAVITVVAFAVVHYDADRGVSVTVFKTFPAIVLVSLYVLTGNVFVVIAVHTIVDALELLVFPAVGGTEADDAGVGPEEQTGAQS